MDVDIDVVEHPNYWSENHPDSCPVCRVCFGCFRPLRPEQFPSDADRCSKCLPAKRAARISRGGL